MTNALIADRYAKALSAAIPNHEDLDANLDALDALSEIFAEAPQLFGVLKDPSITVNVRQNVLEAVLKKLKAPVLAHRAAVLMFRRHRIALLPMAAQMFRRRVDERCNRVAAMVTTAIPLTDEQAAPLAIGLQDYVGREVRMDRRVDEAIVGGVIAEVAGVIIDGSVRARLKRISRELIDNDDLLMN